MEHINKINEIFYKNLPKQMTKTNFVSTANKLHCVLFASNLPFTIKVKYNVSGVSLQYSVNGEDWINILNNGTTVSSKTIYMRGKATGTKSLFSNNFTTNAWEFTGEGDIRSYGILNYLLCDDFGDTEYPMALGATAFASMFRNCTKLVTPPALPATDLSESRCYASMFIGCTKLMEMPHLPATVVGQSGYTSMFSGCSSLKTAKPIMATTVGEQAFASMFKDCVELVSGPDIYAQTLGDAAFTTMFSGCKQLQSIKLHTTSNTVSYFVGWLSGAINAGILYKKGSLFTSQSANSYPETWRQEAF